MLERYKINKQVPPGLLEELKKTNEERTFLTYDGKGITAYIILKDITRNELKQYTSNLTVVYKDLEIPFLVLKYKENSFDIPIFPNESLEIANKLDILIVDLNGYILKSYRRLGLNMNITNAIAAGINFVNTLTKKQIISIIQNQIYIKYTPEQMHKGGIRQVFRK